MLATESKLVTVTSNTHALLQVVIDASLALTLALVFVAIAILAFAIEFPDVGRVITLGK